MVLLLQFANQLNHLQQTILFIRLDLFWIHKFQLILNYSLYLKLWKKIPFAFQSGSHANFQYVEHFIENILQAHSKYSNQSNRIAKKLSFKTWNVD